MFNICELIGEALFWDLSGIFFDVLKNGCKTPVFLQQQKKFLRHNECQQSTSLGVDDDGAQDGVHAPVAA